MHEVSEVLHSFDNFSLQFPIFINVMKIPSLPTDGAAKSTNIRDVNFKKRFRYKRGIITVFNRD